MTRLPSRLHSAVRMDPVRAWSYAGVCGLGGFSSEAIVATVGRNEPCSCGSGKKYKHCCEGRARTLSPAMRLLLVALAVAVVVVILATVLDHGESTGGPGRVWSPEHGHYHDR